MVGARKAMAEQTRVRILATARRLFTDQGYFETGTAEIAAQAGVGTRGALYHHFPSKKALFIAVIEEIEHELSATVAGRVAAETAYARLNQALIGFLDASLDPAVRRILLIDGPAVLGWEAWRELEAQHGLGSLQQMVELGVAEGSIRSRDSRATALLLLALVDEAALFIANSTSPEQSRLAAGETVAGLLSGLAGG